MAKATLYTEKRITVKPNRTDGIVNYDVDNIYPQRVDDIINASGTGATCTRFLAKFILGGGFTDKDFYKSVVNRKGETADKLLRKVADSFSKFKGAALHFNYNALYQKVEASFVPFKHVRFTTDDDKEHPNMLALYTDWDKQQKSTIERKEIDYINHYNPNPTEIQKQVDAVGGWANYKGQILYFTEHGVEYPLATGDAVLEDMQTDAKAKVFKYRNITTNFMASHVFEVDEFMEGENDGNPSADEQRDAFFESLEQFQGDDNALKILLLEKKVGGTPVNIKKVDIQDVDKLYEYTETSVRENIIRQYLIPPILIQSVPNKLGSASEINEAIEYYNMITQDWRLMAEELFAEAFKNFRGLVNPTNDFSIIPATDKMNKPIPAEYLQFVTKNQILTSLGLPETEESAAQVKPLYEALGVGGLQALIATLTNPDLTTEQKVAALKIIFKLGDVEAQQLSKGKEPAGGGFVS